MAARFWVGGGSSANWNATVPTNWSATSGGVGNASVPGASDDATFDGVGALGNTASTVSATITLLSLTITAGYTATMTHNAVATIAGNWTYGGTYTIAGASGITVNAASTITSNGKTWPNALTFANNNTKVLVGNLSVTGSLTCSGVTVINRTTAETLTVAGGIVINNTTSGTAEVIMTGGTWSGSSTIGISNNLTFQGNVTVSGNVYYKGGTLKYTSGTITTAGSTLNITNASTTLDTVGVSWADVTLSATSGQTYTINSLFTATGTLTCGAVALTTFDGTAGFTVGTFVNAATGVSSIVLKNAVTYTITTSLQCKTSRIASAASFSSDHGTTKAILTLNNGAICNCLADFTRVNASNGRSIVTFNGTITDCTNVIEFHDLSTVGSRV